MPTVLHQCKAEFCGHRVRGRASGGLLIPTTYGRVWLPQGLRESRDVEKAPLSTSGTQRGRRTRDYPVPTRGLRWVTSTAVIAYSSGKGKSPERNTGCAAGTRSPLKAEDEARHRESSSSNPTPTETKNSVAATHAGQMRSRWAPKVRTERIKSKPSSAMTDGLTASYQWLDRRGIVTFGLTYYSRRALLFSYIWYPVSNQNHDG